MDELLSRLQQRQHALTLPNWAWTGSAKGMVWHEIQGAIEEIERLRLELAGSSDAALQVHARALKAELDNEELRRQVARLTLRLANELGSDSSRVAVDGRRHAYGSPVGRTEIPGRGWMSSEGGAVFAEPAAAVHHD